MRWIRWSIGGIGLGIIGAVLGFLLWFLRYTGGDPDALLRRAPVLNDRAEVLVLMLDGVPYEVMQQMWERGFFRIFHRPSRVITPFPSMTEVSAALIWEAEQPRGYESLYFDRASRSLEGGARTYLQRRRLAPRDFHRAFDYVEPRGFEFAVYGFPERIFRADLFRFLLAYRDSRKRVFRAFLKSTDGLTHIRGREGLEKALLQLEAVLNRIYTERGGRLKIVLLSEHGNAFSRCQWVDLEAPLRRAGFTVRRRLDPADPTVVVIPSFGLTGYAALYTAPSARRRVAEVLAELPEVAVVAHAEGSDLYVRNREGSARISHDAATRRFRYEALWGDPLALLPVLQRIREAGKMSADGYVADEVWFAALASHPFPDALFRLWQATRGLVQNPADVLVGFRDGFVYGARAFRVYDALIPVRAIHGGLTGAQSTGFFMATHAEAPPHIRPQWVKPLLGEWGIVP